MAKKGIGGRALERLQEVSGQSLVSTERLELLETVAEDHRVVSRQLEDIGWQVLDVLGGNPQELNPASRKAMVAKSRHVWMNDPQAGAAVDLMNDFVFGRGVPKARAKDAKVQEVIDEFWDDPDNSAVLTSYEAQMALGVDLALQSNVFLLMFDDGDDGKVKLSILRHDDVTGAVQDPDKRHRVLWYLAVSTRQEWDYKTHRYNVDYQRQVQVEPTYYEHYRNVELAEEERGRDTPAQRPADGLIGEGKVYHVRINRTTEQVFGVPRFQRTLRWLTAYNTYMAARVDIAQAAAQFIMKRKIKGTPTQLVRDAAKLLSRRGPLGAGVVDPNIQAGPRPASILEENESVDHEPFTIDTKSGGAMQDAQMIRAPFSAAERFPQSYFGDATNTSLAAATSLELPVLKAVEGRQEAFEGIFRWALDRAIEKAVDSGRISRDADPEPAERADQGEASLEQALVEAAGLGEELVEVVRVRWPSGTRGEVFLVTTFEPDKVALRYRVVEGYDGQGTDEKANERDLSYDFSMPSPLRRMMTDLVTAITGIASTFDPNNSNIELSRALLTIALGEAFEVQDPADLVDQIFPEGYVDPLVAQAQAQAAAMQPDPNAGFGPGDSGGPFPDKQFPAGADGNAYGAPMNSPPAEARRGRGVYSSQQAEEIEESRELTRLVVTRARNGEPIVWSSPRTGEVRAQLEEHYDDREIEKARGEGAKREADDLFTREVVGASMRALDSHTFLRDE